MWDATSDPLGNDLQQRATAKRLQTTLDSFKDPLHPQIGPLPDMNWDKYFEATDEASGGKPVSYAYSPGANGAPDTTRDPTWGAEVEAGSPNTNVPLMKSNQLGTALDGLKYRMAKGK